MSIYVELLAARRRLRAEGRAQVDEAALFAAREANHALVATARRARAVGCGASLVGRERHRAEVKPAPIAEGEAPTEPPDATAPINPGSAFVVEIEPW